MTELSQNKNNAAESPVTEDVRNSMPKTSAKDAFVEWLSTPEPYRSPATARDFAKQYGVSERTLLRWKTQTAVLEKVERLVAVHARSRFADVANAIVASALAGDVSAQKLFLANFVPNAKPETEQREIVIKFGDEEIVPFFAQPGFTKKLPSAADDK